jgi:hypothetical protein
VTADPRPGGSGNAAGTPPFTEPETRRTHQLDLSRLLPDNLSDLAATETRQDSAESTHTTANQAHTTADQVQPTANPAQPARADDPQSATDKPGPPTIWEQMGGPMGMVDSGLPVVVFIIGNAIGGLGWGIGAALTAAVLIAIMRIARRRPVTQAIAGVFGVGIAAFIAYKTDSAKGYFLLGIWSYLLYGGALLVSMLVRWPLIGVIWEGINGRGSGWRSDRKLVRRYDYATFVWVLVFAARYLVQNYLYDTDQVGWLAAVRLLMGYPVFILAIAVSVWIVAGGSAVKLPDALTRRGRAARPAEETGES